MLYPTKNERKFVQGSDRPKRYEHHSSAAQTWVRCGDIAITRAARGNAALLIRSLPSSTRATRTSRVKLLPPMRRMKTERFEDFHSRPPSCVFRTSYSTAKIAPVQEI